MRLAAVLLLVALAGCLSAGNEATPAEPAGPDVELPGKQGPGLRGVVVDAAIRPLAGVSVKVLETDAATITAADGTYDLTGLPLDRFIVVVAQHEGFRMSSKQLTLQPEAPTTLDFTLEPLPSGTPSVDKQSFDGYIECQAAVMGPAGDQFQDCGSGEQTRTVWEVAVQPTLAGAVFEVFWDPNGPALHSLGARLEKLMGDGAEPVLLGEIVGESPLRITLAKAVVAQQLPQGGNLRLTVQAEPNGEELEAAIAAAVEIQQEFDAYASLFYVEGPDPAYTIADQ